MSEERFDRIEQKLSAVQDGLNRTDERLDRLEIRVDEGFARMDAGFAATNVALAATNVALAELRREMHILHEDTIARFKAIPERAVPTKAEFVEGLAAERERTDRRLDPLEAVVRQHSKEIDRLKRRGS